MANPSVTSYELRRSARNVIKNLTKRIYSIFIGKGHNRSH
jgi:hypothetical protein